MIRIIKIRAQWIKRFLLALLILAAWMIWRVEKSEPLQRPAIPEESAAEADTVWAVASTPHGPISLHRAVICLDVDHGRPLGIKPAYNHRVDYLFCWTMLTALQGPVTVTHRWKNGDRTVFEKSMVVYGKHVRLWSRRQLFMKQSGAWRVEIITESGTVLGAVAFSLI
jgi:hypothetical protein